MVPKWPCVWLLACLVLLLDATAAGKLAPLRGRDDSTTALSSSTTGTAQSVTTSTTSLVSSTFTPTPSSTNTTASNATATSAILSNSTSIFNNATIPAGQLPLHPQLTPGWGVAGALMIVTGCVYTLVGIKSNSIHTFLSTAYLASLGATVLIVYVMPISVSQGVQGGYVVGVVAAGAAFGGAALFFKEITEGLGCLLGGFCLSMWLLTLRAGGLLTTVSAKAAFIAAFTAVGFSFSFSHYTRQYALIGCISFAGATVTVLGIDCFSKAGLKEFWAYIWALNSNLFPLGTTTYPLTRGIKVEMALVMFICLVGILSQIRLWRIVKQHRANRAEEQVQIRQARDAEEANLGQQMEAEIARDRAQWEAAYGEKPPPSPVGSGNSGSLNEKKGRFSESIKSTDNPSETGALRAKTSPPTRSTHSIVPNMPSKRSKEVIIADTQVDEGEEASPMVAEDGGQWQDCSNTLLTPGPVQHENLWIVGADGEARPTSSSSPRGSKRLSNTPPVIPLPFHVSNRPSSPGDEVRSSCATIADDQDETLRVNRRGSKASLRDMLSSGSGGIWRSLSRRSLASFGSKASKQTRDEAQRGSTELQQGLVMQGEARDADATSLAATLDETSEDGMDMPTPSEHGEKVTPIDVKPDLRDIDPDTFGGLSPRPAAERRISLDGQKSVQARPDSGAETVSTGILNTSTLGDTVRAALKRDSSGSAVEVHDPLETSRSEDTAKPADETPQVPATSMPSSASFMEDDLSPAMSSVVSTYRTNEWAKHLSQAESPAEMVEVPLDSENAAPVDVNSLQQTATDAGRAPAASRPASSLHRDSSGTASSFQMRAAVLGYPSPTQISVGDTDTQVRESGALTSLASANPVHVTFTGRKKTAPNSRRMSREISVQPIPEEYSSAQTPITTIPESEAYVESSGASIKTTSSTSSKRKEANPRPPVPGIVSYTSPQTLLGQRDMMLRSKSYGSFVLFESGASSPTVSHSPEKQSSPVASLHNVPVSSTYKDIDDLPLSQRKELMRQNSNISQVSGPGANRGNVAYVPTASGPLPESRSFESQQAMDRRRSLPSQLAREAQLANFRNSVAQELRNGPSVIPYSRSGSSLAFSSSMGNLVQNMDGMAPPPGVRENEVRRSIEHSRSMMMLQRDQEVQKREAQRWEKQKFDRAFEERMRSGELLDAHREALRRLQSGAK